MFCDFKRVRLLLLTDLAAEKWEWSLKRMIGRETGLPWSDVS
jgi:hypothetical protein